MEKAMMKQGIVYVLAMAFLLPAAPGKKERKIDPKLKGIHTIFVQGGEGSGVRDARESLAMSKCFQLAPDAEKADALMTVMRSFDTNVLTGRIYGDDGLQAGHEPGLTVREKTNQSTVILKVREGEKLKKVWSDSIDLGGSEETKKSGVRRLIEKLSEEVCGGP
jgi:hypothetical protein